MIKWFPRFLLVGALAALAQLAAPLPAAAQSSGRCGEAIRVQPGDTLFRIAHYCGTTIAELVRANPRITNPNRIYAGQIIRMPLQRARRAPSRPEDCGSSVTFRTGDTLAWIAQQCGTTVTALLRANPQIRDVSTIRLGEVIRMPRAVPERRPRAEPRRASPRTPAQPSPGIEVVGTLTREGATCPALRGDDGRLYTLAGHIGNFIPGDRVWVQGEQAEMSTCMQGVTIAIDRILRAR